MQREREQLSESRERLRSIEETLNQLVEKIDQLAETVGQLAESQPEEDRLDRETLREELQEAIPRETPKGVQELRSTLEKAIEEGIPVKGREEYQRLREKVEQLVRQIRVKAELLQQGEEIQEKVNQALKNLENEKRKMKNDHSSLLRRLERTAGALESKWRRRVWAGLVGGVVGTVVLAGIGWASMQTLPQKWRMTPGEIRQAEGLERLEAATSENLTEEEYETYRKLLKKAYERDQDSRQ